MSKAWSAAGVVVLLLLVGVGAALVTGVGPFTGETDAPDAANDTTTDDRVDGDEARRSTTATTTADGGLVDLGEETTTSDGSTGDATATATTTATRSPFAFTIDRIEECGQTCRDVTVTLTNQQDVEATNVRVSTTIYAGNGTDGEQVWSGEEAVSTLGRGESYTATRRVELSYFDALAVQDAGGWITVETTITADGEEITVTQRRKVA